MGKVSSNNEWDCLEEVIVGRVDNAHLPEWDEINRFSMPPGEWEDLPQALGLKSCRRFPDESVSKAQRALGNLVEALQTHGVTVRYPEKYEFDRAYSTPKWRSSTGFNAANPRDSLLVVGNTIIEAPMADRGRYFERFAYRSLLKEYFASGASWVAAPIPELVDINYDADFKNNGCAYVLTENEPLFDAADFLRCGKTLFCQKSHVTNQSGIDWLRNFLGSSYEVRVLESQDPYAVHIDTTLMPLAPGKMLVNPEKIDLKKVPAVLSDWELLEAPLPIKMPLKARGFVSDWISINVLNLDKKKVLVEAGQLALIDKLDYWGFTPVPVDFADYYPFGGGLHCATLDIRRKEDI